MGEYPFWMDLLDSIFEMGFFLLILFVIINSLIMLLPYLFSTKSKVFPKKNNKQDFLVLTTKGTFLDLAPDAIYHGML